MHLHPSGERSIKFLYSGLGQIALLTPVSDILRSTTPESDVSPSLVPPFSSYGNLANAFVRLSGDFLFPS